MAEEKTKKEQVIIASDPQVIYLLTNKDKGVTPLCIRHKCGGIMMHEYTISEEEAKAAGAKVFNWVRPSWRFVRRNPACWEHIMGGGLNLVD